MLNRLLLLEFVGIGANETRKNELCRLNLTLNSADYKRVGEILGGEVEEMDFATLVRTSNANFIAHRL